MNLLVGPFLLSLNASLSALLGVFFIGGFPQQQPAEISHHIGVPSSCYMYKMNIKPPKISRGSVSISLTITTSILGQENKLQSAKNNYLNLPHMSKV